MNWPGSWDGFGIELLAADSASELSRFYWETDIPVAEIAAAFGLPNDRSVRLAAGEGILWPLGCRRCDDVVRTNSRTDAMQRFDLLERWGTSRFSRLAEWAYPDICDSCSTELRGNAAAESRRKRQMDEARRSLLRTMPYAEYLKSPEWQERRAQVLKASRYRCQVCSANNVPLHVHHRTYVRRGEEATRDLIVLCAGCHELFHHNGKLADFGRADDR